MQVISILNFGILLTCIGIAEVYRRLECFFLTAYYPHQLFMNDTLFTKLFSIIIKGGGGWGVGGSNKAWDRETMFSQLAKRSARQRF